ncbi:MULTISPECIES: hypothetical protein [unclassified Adlercreutzia]|uniref:hypothetical protein n=1 Tax=unclassified Adlercreutzia TaxID=2636013 RepID=UPI0013EAB75D|nr:MULTISPECIES: hypothetical protein [unclassified Adlercreutzia]
MKHSKIARLLALTCVGILVAAALAGCAQQNNAANEQQTKSRQYMSSVNQTMEDLSSRLESFEDAVSRGDAVTMRTQADNAFKALDALAAIEVPEGLGDVQTGYVDGCNKLKEALNAYIELYTEIDSATEEHPFDYATYDDRIKSIQELYDEGVSLLEETDKKATEL